MHLLVLVACSGGGPNKTDDSVAGSGDSEPATDPNVPEGYEDKWDTSGGGCEGSRWGNTSAYLLAEGSSDAEGNFTATETWYTFNGGDWEDDTVDIYSYEGVAMTRSELNALDASEAEEGYVVEKTAIQDESGSWGAEGERGLVFDTLTPSGNLNWENAMLVFMYSPGWGDSEEWRANTDYARGVFLPDGEVLGPPAHYTWAGHNCR
jgi:hypothetical protein